MQKTIAKLTLLLLATSLLSACGIEQVDEGFRGVKKVWGKVEGAPLGPGIYFYNPVSTSIFEMNVRETKLEADTSCYTKDTQTVKVSYALTYYPKADQIGAVYAQFGKGWVQKVVDPAVTGSLKDAIGQNIADDLISKRDLVRKEAFEQIKEALGARDVIVTKLDLIDLEFEQDYEKAVENKVVAIQKAMEAKNKTVEVEEQAKQQVLKAKAEAESMRIRAKALTQNKGLVDYEAVQRWDGKLPQYVLSTGAMPFIKLKGLK